MSKETKAAYNWVDEGLHVRRGLVELGEAKEAIARRMNMETDEVDTMIETMALVDLYLSWLEMEGRYHKVGINDEQSFEELRLRTRRASYRNLSRVHQLAVRDAVFALVKDQRGYQEVRDVADFMIKQLGKFADRVRDEGIPEVVELLNQPPDPGSGSHGSDSLLDELADSAEKGELPPGIELANLVREPPQTGEVAAVLANVADDLKAEEKEQNDLDEPLRKVKRALQALQGVRLSAETPRRDEIARLLGDLIATAETLGRQIDQLESNSED